MNIELETFLLYYTCWHEGEFPLAEFKKSLLDEIGAEGLKSALNQFKGMCGNYRTYYEFQKDLEKCK